MGNMVAVPDRISTLELSRLWIQKALQELNLDSMEDSEESELQEQPQEEDS